MFRAVSYCRVSTDAEDQRNSLLNQTQYFMTEIDRATFKPEGFTLVKECGNNGIYADEGISGTSLKKRDQFAKLLSDAKKHKFDYIFTKNVSRWARNVEDTKRELRILKELGIGVYFLTERLDSLDGNADFMISMFASLAQEESRQISDRVKFGLRKSAQSGHWSGLPPYGYDNLDKVLVVNEVEAEVVREIFNLYDQGWGSLKITNSLNSRDIPPKLATLWHQLVVRNILRNPLYTGIVRQHRREMIDPIAHIKQNVSEDKWIIFEDAKLRIIDQDLFDRTQVEIERRTTLVSNKVTDTYYRISCTVVTAVVA